MGFFLNENPKTEVLNENFKKVIIYTLVKEIIFVFIYVCLKIMLKFVKLCENLIETSTEILHSLQLPEIPLPYPSP